MLILTEDALIGCAHDPPGTVGLDPAQSWVTVSGRKVLIDPDPEGRPISKCPNIGISIKPCQLTLRVEQGYSTFIRVGGRRVCLDTVVGKTDGTPPGVVIYHVLKPGQAFVEGAG